MKNMVDDGKIISKKCPRCGNSYFMYLKRKKLMFCLLCGFEYNLLAYLSDE